MDKPSTVTILYHQNQLCNLNWTAATTLNDLRNDLVQKYQLSPHLVILMNKSDTVSDYQQMVNSILKNGKENNELTLSRIGTKVSFYQMDNEDNCFTFDYDLMELSIPSFKQSTFSFFKEKMDEFNYKISLYEFYTNDSEEDLFFQDNNKLFQLYFSPDDLLTIKFYFLIKNESVMFYKTIRASLNQINEEVDEANEKIEKIVLRKDVSNGQMFSIVIQTYNHLIKEISVYPEMTIEELKEKIEEAFLVRKEYQKLLYLVYKLKDDSKKLKDYYIRPQGIIFLRGFFFPIIFVDFYQKSNKNVIAINIAERISVVKEELIAKLGLESGYDYKLILNGKELNDECFLIDYNIQRMQMIYFK